MRYGSFLKKKGTIGCIAPSFGCNIEPYKTAFEQAVTNWRNDGYAVRLGPNVYESRGLGISNTPEKCAKEFMDFYQSPETDVLISCGGGELMCEILPYVDFESIGKGAPKWFMGYSDNTNLVFPLTTLCDVAAVYGPCAPAFGMEPWHPAIEDALGVLTGHVSAVHNYDLWEKESLKTEANPLAPYHVTEPDTLRGWPKEECALSGRLIGGCLDCLTALCGTRYDRVEAFADKYKEDGILWFMEACDLNPVGIRRALWQLREAGWFQYASGFLIGRPWHFGESLFGVDQYNAVTDILGDLGVPVVMDLDIGHLPPMMPIVSGSVGYASVKGGRFEMRMDYR